MENKDNSKHCYLLLSFIRCTPPPHPIWAMPERERCTMSCLYTVQYVFLLTEQAETYLKIYALKHHLRYIWPSLFGWMENMIFKETVTGYFDWLWASVKMKSEISFKVFIRKEHRKNNLKNIFFPWESGFWISVFGNRAILLYRQHILQCSTFGCFHRLSTTYSHKLYIHSVKSQWCRAGASSGTFSLGGGWRG